MPDGFPPASVIVPVHDGAATLRTCLDALCALDYPPRALEIIVVDNRSTDATRAIVARYPVRLIDEHGAQSSYAARNRGALAASGSVLAFTDADCVPDRAWLRALVRPLATPGVGGVAGSIVQRLVELGAWARALKPVAAESRAYALAWSAQRTRYDLRPTERALGWAPRVGLDDGLRGPASSDAVSMAAAS